MTALIALLKVTFPVESLLVVLLNRLGAELPHVAGPLLPGLGQGSSRESRLDLGF
jgi:hypothetical protein